LQFRRLNFAASQRFDELCCQHLTVMAAIQMRKQKCQHAIQWNRGVMQACGPRLFCCRLNPRKQPAKWTFLRGTPYLQGEG